MMTFLIFSDDWGRHPSSCQHLTRILLENETDRVFWVNTIGTRPPGLNLLTFRRAAEKFSAWLTARNVSSGPDAGKNSWTPQEKTREKTCEKPQDKTREKQPEVLHPWMWPWFRTAFDRKLNRNLLVRQLKRRLAEEQNITVLTTLPIVADLIGVLPNVRQWVYYCVDDWSRWPGMDAEPLAKMEAKLVQNADKIITAGEALRDRIQEMGRTSLLLTHGVDLEFWQNSKEFRELSEASLNVTAKLPVKKEWTAILPEFLQNLSHPVFTFWGLIDERLDSGMVESLAAKMPEGTLILAGPTAAPEIAERLKRFPNVRLPGPVPYEELPLLASKADVLIMPYRKNEATEQIQPLKMTEYLASGKPAVVCDLRAAEAWHDALDVVRNSEEFVRMAVLRAESGLPDSQRAARERLKNETWNEKAVQLMRFLNIEPQKND